MTRTHVNRAGTDVDIFPQTLVSFSVSDSRKLYNKQANKDGYGTIIIIKYSDLMEAICFSVSKLSRKLLTAAFIKSSFYLLCFVFIYLF